MALRGVSDGKYYIVDYDQNTWPFYGDTNLLIWGKKYFQDWFMFSNGLAWLCAKQTERLKKKIYAL